MRLLVLSDLHLNIWRGHHPKTDLDICKPDVVILAGDIHSGTKAVPWAVETFPGIPVLYVHGNHEAYGDNLDTTQKKILAECNETTTVHFLHGSEFRLDNVRFFGWPLWTDFKLFGEWRRLDAMNAAHAYMNDYQAIRIASAGYRKLRPADTAAFHASQKETLQQFIDSPFEGKTVVITHMAPSIKSVADRYCSDIVSAAYASNLDHMVDQVDLWVHGHTHDSFDYHIGKGRVICNPCGYPYGGRTENAQFNPNLIIEI